MVVENRVKVGGLTKEGYKMTVVGVTFDTEAAGLVNRLLDDLQKTGYQAQAIYTTTEKDSLGKVDTLVVCLSPRALQNDEIREVVQDCIEQNIPVIPLLAAGTLAHIAKYQPIRTVLEETIDYPSIGYEKAFAELLRSFHRIKALRGGKKARQREQMHAMRHVEGYLRRLHAQIGHLNLSRVVASQSKVPLERVYTSLHIEFLLSVEVKDYRIVDWWLSKRAEIQQGAPVDRSASKKQWLGSGAQLTALERLVKDVQHAIDQGIDSHYDDPRDRPLILAPPWYDGIKEGFWPLREIDAISTYERLVILGAPGSGKTTFARYIALCLLGAKLRPELKNANLDNLGKWPYGPLTPVYVELRLLVSWEEFPALGQPVTEDHFWSYIKEKVLGPNLTEVANDLRTELVEGRGLIILDGLDEVPVPPGAEALEKRRRQLKDLARELDAVYNNSRIIFTSRDYAYRDWELANFMPVHLNPLSLKQMHRLATNLYLQRDLDEIAAKERADALIEALKRVPGALKDYPLFLTLMATLFLHGESEGLPAKRGALYHASIMLLLDRWTQSRLNEPSLVDQIGCSVEELYRRLEVVAYKTHLGAEAEDEVASRIDFGLLLTEMFRIGPSTNIHLILAFLCQQAGVLISPESEVYQFAHRGFQEYLAASYMYRQFQKYLETGLDDDFSLVRDHIEQQPLLWREPCVLLGEILTQRGQQDRLWTLIYTLLNGDSNQQARIAQFPRWWPIWLAGKIVLDQELYKGKVHFLSRSVHDELRTKLQTLLETHGSLPASERAEVGIALGLLGDPRPGVGVRDGVPDIFWCPVPGGVFQMGTTPEQIREIQRFDWAKGWEFTRETPSTTIHLPTFEISRYPITQAQFKAFLDDAENGYFQRRWWLDEGWAWLEQTQGPLEPDWGQFPNLPRTNVSWYEATAFCNWLSSKLNCQIRLPTEAEWEKSARGTDGRLFPWGNNFDPSRCNFNQSGFGKPTPVGCYLTMESPQGEDSGPLDMSGNVWEWCTTVAEKVGGEPISYPYEPMDARENMELGDDYYRVVRGGSFLNPPFLVRAAYRGRDLPHHRPGRVGFRIIKVQD